MRPFLSRLTLILFAGALALRVLLAPGLMPTATAHGVQLTMCSGQMPAHDGQPATPCPFQAIAAPAMPMAAPAVLAGAPPLTPAPGLPLTLTERVHGPPPLLPPATGPPVLA